MIQLTKTWMKIHNASSIRPIEKIIPDEFSKFSCNLQGLIFPKTK
jgi:hypothetical protein